jgi:phosphate transport system permease protein
MTRRGGSHGESRRPEKGDGMSVSTGTSPAAATAPAPAPRSRTVLADLIFRGVSFVSALVVPTVIVAMVLFLALRSVPVLSQHGSEFFFSADWNSGSQKFGALALVYGTLVTSILAMLLAVPLGVGAAAFLSEIASGPIRRVASFLIELLAAIPSVVYGFWGLFFVVPLLEHLFNAVGLQGQDITGKGLFTCGVLLAIMIVPYITAITYDVCQAVPTAQRQGALALGATRWQTISRVVLPYARPGIIGGCFLALGRALGETMAVAMVIGNNAQIVASLRGLLGHGYSIPSVMANEWDSANTEMQKSALVALGLVLFLVTVAVNALARAMIWNLTRKASAAPLAVAEPAPGSPGGASPFTTSTPLDGKAPVDTPRVSQLTNPTAKPINLLMTWLLFTCVAVIVVPLFHILWYITYLGVSHISWSFFTHQYALDEPKGLGHALLGTLYIVAMATAAAVPIGILAALYLTEYPRSRINPTVRFFGELLSGVPSIVLGIFSYAVLVIPFKESAYAAAFALAVMMLPIVMRASEEALKLVPISLRNASYALGATRWQTVSRVLLPAALPAVITGVFLAVARIAGETAPLLFTAGASGYWPTGLNHKTPFLTYYIYNGAIGNDPEMRDLAWGGAFVLLAFVMMLNIGIRLIAGRRAVSAARAE